MPYIPVPKDLTKVKSKVLFNLTRRQLVCFGGGALVGVPLFFLLKEPLGNSSAAICMIVAILLNVADAGLSPAQLETMLRSPCPLEDVFKDYRQMDSLSYPAWDFRDAISQRADDAMEQQRSVPIYDGTAREANERGEVEKFKASAEADENCKTAIENAIARNYDGSRLNTKAAIAEVREQFGEKRLTRVTASLIVNRPHDGRISPENMAWAEKNAATKKVCTNRTHSGLLDIFAARLREGERKRERGAER